MDAFYGPDAETLEGETALARRIQVTKDMTALCRLWEPNRRGKRSNCSKDDGNDETKHEEDSIPGVAEMKCPTDVCITCEGSCSNPRKFGRIDSLRRHLIDQHFGRLAERTGVHCARETCKGEAAFVDVTVFLCHAVTVHDYDLKRTPRHLKHYRRTRLERENEEARTGSCLAVRDVI